MNSRQVQVAALKSMFDDLIDNHAEAYLEAYPEVKEFSNFEKSGTANYYIGMVWTSDYERPDVSQLRIRGSLSLARNKVLELDLGALRSQHTFYPGQIIALKALPSIKRQLSVVEILDPIRIAPTLKPIVTEGKKNVFIASGPYMKPEDEDWTLFEQMIDEIRSNNPTHVVLIGPFVDLENKYTRGNYDVSWRFVFDKLTEAFHDVECQVFLVPSGRDILPSYLRSNYFYPTPKLEFKLNLKDGIKPKCTITSVTDPAQIDLGGLYLEVTSADVLFHLNKSLSFINKDSSNMFNTMFKHLLTQGIYPIYPAPCDLAVDFVKLAKHIQPNRIGPHILVLPTKFNTSVNNVHDRVVVAVHKCSTKRQIVMIEIPAIGLNESSKSLVSTDYTHRLLDLNRSMEVQQSSSSSAGAQVNSAREMTSSSTSETSQQAPIEGVAPIQGVAS